MPWGPGEFPPAQTAQPTSWDGARNRSPFFLELALYSFVAASLLAFLLQKMFGGQKRLWSRRSERVATIVSMIFCAAPLATIILSFIFGVCLSHAEGWPAQMGVDHVASSIVSLVKPLASYHPSTVAGLGIDGFASVAFLLARGVLLGVALCSATMSDMCDTVPASGCGLIFTCTIYLPTLVLLSSVVLAATLGSLEGWPSHDAFCGMLHVLCCPRRHVLLISPIQLEAPLLGILLGSLQICLDCTVVGIFSRHEIVSKFAEMIAGSHVRTSSGALKIGVVKEDGISAPITYKDSNSHRRDVLLSLLIAIGMLAIMFCWSAVGTFGNSGDGFLTLSMLFCGGVMLLHAAASHSITNATFQRTLWAFGTMPSVVLVCSIFLGVAVAYANHWPCHIGIEYTAGKLARLGQPLNGVIPQHFIGETLDVVETILGQLLSCAIIAVTALLIPHWIPWVGHAWWRGASGLACVLGICIPSAVFVMALVMGYLMRQAESWTFVEGTVFILRALSGSADQFQIGPRTANGQILTIVANTLELILRGVIVGVVGTHPALEHMLTFLQDNSQRYELTVAVPSNDEDLPCFQSPTEASPRVSSRSSRTVLPLSDAASLADAFDKGGALLKSLAQAASTSTRSSSELKSSRSNSRRILDDDAKAFNEHERHQPMVLTEQRWGRSQSHGKNQGRSAEKFDRETVREAVTREQTLDSTTLQFLGNRVQSYFASATANQSLARPSREPTSEVATEEPAFRCRFTVSPSLRAPPPSRPPEMSHLYALASLEGSALDELEGSALPSVMREDWPASLVSGHRF